MWRSLASMAVAMLRSQAKSLARTIRALAEMAALPVVVVVVVATLVEGSLLLSGLKPTLARQLDLDTSAVLPLASPPRRKVWAARTRT